VPLDTGENLGRFESLIVLRLINVGSTHGPTQHRARTVRLTFPRDEGYNWLSGVFIFNGDHSKVEALDELVTQKAGFESSFIVTSQTYSRKIDADVLNALGSFGATCQRIRGDIRHLAM
jgi:hypothetical protein